MLLTCGYLISVENSFLRWVWREIRFFCLFRKQHPEAPSKKRSKAENPIRRSNKMAYLGLGKPFWPIGSLSSLTSNFLHQWSAFLYPSFFLFCGFVTWPDDEENDCYSHQRAPLFSCPHHPGHDISWSCAPLSGGWVWPPLYHGLCMHPKWNQTETHLVKVWKGSTLQRIFVFGDEKKWNIVDSHRIEAGSSYPTWSSPLKNGSNTGHIIWS